MAATQERETILVVLRFHFRCCTTPHSRRRARQASSTLLCYCYGMESISIAEIKRRLAAGEYGLVAKEGAKAAVWKTFKLVVDSEKKVLDYVQCIKCKTVLSYDSKRTGTSTMGRHMEKVCATFPQQSTDQQQQSMATFVTKSADSVLRAKQRVTSKCVSFCIL